MNLSDKHDAEHQSAPLKRVTTRRLQDMKKNKRKYHVLQPMMH